MAGDGWCWGGVHARKSFGISFVPYLVLKRELVFLYCGVRPVLLKVLYIIVPSGLCSLVLLVFILKVLIYNMKRKNRNGI